jgi:hypothetical protein
MIAITATIASPKVALNKKRVTAMLASNHYVKNDCHKQPKTEPFHIKTPLLL